MNGKSRFIWAGAVEKTVIKIAERQVWRTLPEYDVDDLYQEGFLVFLKCRERYRPDTKSHGRGLFVRSFMNRVHDLAIKRTKRKEVSQQYDHGCDNGGLDVVDVLLQVSEAPPVIRKLLNGLSEIGSEDRQFRKSDTGQRETTTEYLSRLAGEFCSGNTFNSWLSGEAVCSPA